MPESKNVDGRVELSACLQGFKSFVTYTPLRTEVAWADYYTLPSGAKIYAIAPRASLDPAQEALRALELFGDTSACVLLPGRSFDTLGTRHGQGGGWYDRFLARVPGSWLRVGFCFSTQLSQEPLAKAPWDQSVDVVCVVNDTSQMLSTYKTPPRIW